MTTSSTTDPENITEMPTDSHGHPDRNPKKIILMNCETYYAIITYLEQRELPKHIDKWTMNTVQREAKKFDLGLDQTLYKNNRLVIPEHRKHETIRMTHNKRHLGGTNDYYLLRQHCWWPNMEEDIRRFVKECTTCQKQKQD